MLLNGMQSFLDKRKFHLRIIAKTLPKYIVKLRSWYSATLHEVVFKLIEHKWRHGNIVIEDLMAYDFAEAMVLDTFE